MKLSRFTFPKAIPWMVPFLCFFPPLFPSLPPPHVPSPFVGPGSKGASRVSDPVFTAPSGFANSDKMTSTRRRDCPGQRKEKDGDKVAFLVRKAAIVVVVVVVVMVIVVVATSSSNAH